MKDGPYMPNLRRTAVRMRDTCKFLDGELDADNAHSALHSPVLAMPLTVRRDLITQNSSRQHDSAVNLLRLHLTRGHFCEG